MAWPILSLLAALLVLLVGCAQGMVTAPTSQHFLMSGAATLIGAALFLASLVAFTVPSLRRPIGIAAVAAVIGLFAFASIVAD